MPPKKRVRRNERAHRTGSIKDLPDGSARAWRPPQPDGTRPSKLFHPPDARAKAEGWLKGIEPGPSMPLGVWAEVWCTRRWARLGPRTRRNYVRLLGYLEPLAPRALASLTVDDWQRHIDALLERQTRTSVAVARSLWSAVLGAAVRAGHIAANPLLETALPRAVEKVPPAWRQDEVRRLLAAAEGHHHAAWLHLGLSLGLRMGELRALEWTDVDLPNLRVTISKGLDNETDESGPTKSGRIRILDLPVEAAQILADHAKRQPPGTLLVCGHDGRAYDPQTYRDWLRGLCDRAGVARHHPHAMRHTFASLAIAAGVPLTDVSQALGHADIGITAKVYSHAIRAAERLAANAMSRALYGASEDLHTNLHNPGAATR